ncbi:MAG: hypothetical protein ACP5DX_07775 [Paracoccaceae bacterium]
MKQSARAAPSMIVAVFLLEDRIPSNWRCPALIIVTTVAFGIALWIADGKADWTSVTVAVLSWHDAVLAMKLLAGQI